MCVVTCVAQCACAEGNLREISPLLPSCMFQGLIEATGLVTALYLLKQSRCHFEPWILSHTALFTNIPPMDLGKRGLWCWWLLTPHQAVLMKKLRVS